MADTSSTDDPALGAPFWEKRWADNDIGFHQDAVHPALTEHWSRLGLEAGSAVFVPLCGKSRDMVWLADAGHQVIGVELSEIAVDAFFAETGLTPTVETSEHFKIKSAGPYQIYCGDLFQMPLSAFMHVDAVFDRASLVALPPEGQAKYAEYLSGHLLPHSKVFLLSLDYATEEMSGPPFATPDGQVSALFQNSFDIMEVTARDSLADNAKMRERGLTKLTESLYILRPKVRAGG